MAETIWQKVLALLSEELTQVAMDTWFKNTKAVTIDDYRIVVAAPSEFVRKTIEQRYRPMILAALREIFAGDFDVHIIDESEIPAYEKENEPAPDGDIVSSKNYTFENFVVGASNKFAHAAAIAVAKEETKNYNPLFIYGNSGLGKTHLLYAIRHVIEQKHPEYNIVFVRGNDFMNELIQAIQTGRNVNFREKYRSADLFLMDDIQIIAGKDATQDEFFHTFNALYESQKQIVFTSDRPPSEMTALVDRLRTRFESGLLADIQPPDYETRMAIINNKAMQLGMVLPNDIAAYIADNMTANVRQLEGAVKKIKATYDMGEAKTITVFEVARIIKDMFKEKTQYTATPEDIVEETAKYYGLTVADLKGQSRMRNTASARQIAMYLIRKITNLSLQDIGVIFDGRDHSTVLTSIRKIEKNVEENESFSNIIRDITANINAKNDN